MSQEPLKTKVICEHSITKQIGQDFQKWTYGLHEEIYISQSREKKMDELEALVMAKIAKAETFADDSNRDISRGAKIESAKPKTPDKVEPAKPTTGPSTATGKPGLLEKQSSPQTAEIMRLHWKESDKRPGNFFTNVDQRDDSGNLDQGLCEIARRLLLDIQAAQASGSKALHYEGRAFWVSQLENPRQGLMTFLWYTEEPR